jgi:large repetitive protein
MYSPPRSRLQRRSAVVVLAGLVLATVGVFGLTPAGADDCTDEVLTATADAWVDQSSPSSNKGSDAILKVRSQGPSGNFRALVRFDLPTVPAGCSVESATLRMYAASSVAGRTLEARRVTAPWSESTVTWTNQPSAEPAATTSSGLGYRQWAVTAEVKAIAEGAAANHGFRIQDSQENGSGEQSFHARDKGSDPPVLVITYGTDGSTTPLACGDIVTRSVQLQRDLVDQSGSGCPADGLLIGASGITVDLNGHTIRGSGLGVGIANNGFDDVTITNGTIREFDIGVQLNVGTETNLVETLSLESNQYDGIELNSAGAEDAGNRIRANALHSNGLGIDVSGGSHNVIEGNTIVGSANGALRLAGTRHNTVSGNSLLGSGDGSMALSNAHDNTITANTFTGSGDGSLNLDASDRNTVTANTAADNSDAAFTLENGSDDNLVADNTVGGTSNDDGFQVYDSERNTLANNDARGAGDSGITLARAHDNVIRDNTVTDNVGGLEVSDSDRNRLENNDASRSNGAAIKIMDSSANEVVGNVASHSGGRGIEVTGAPDTAQQGNVLEGNTASGNGGSGIVLAAGGHTLRNNVANHNGSWGMHATEGSVDGGGNTAVGNAEALQCFGVVCGGSTPPPDDTPPETTIDSAPDGTTTSRVATFTFSASEAGSTFACSLDGADFTPCVSGVSYEGLDLGEHTFEVRATDAAGNTDPTPARHAWTIVADTTPPEATITGSPSDPSRSRTATFSFTGSDDTTAPELLEFECRLDSADELDWNECDSPVSYHLASGEHTFEVRAIDEEENVGSPASFRWTILPPETCEEASGTVAPDADAWVNEGSPDNNAGGDAILTVASKGPSDNARALVRFPLPTDVPADCELASATLRLYAPSASPERTLEALPLAQPWAEDGVTWNDQPATRGPVATTSSGVGHRSWNVTTAVREMYADLPGHGFLIRDAAEGQDADQSFHSREKLDNEPQLTLVYQPEGYEPPPPPPLEEPEPAEVTCGQVLTRSTLVLNDLEDCPGDGLVVGSRIILDLNGKTIDGVGLLPNAEVPPAGVRNAGFDDVVVRNGTVQEFHVGVAVTPDLQSSGTRGVTVRDLTLQGNVFAGADLQDAEGAAIKDNHLLGNGDGIMVADSVGGLIASNVLTANLDAAIQLRDSSEIRIESNTLTGGTDGLRVGDEAMRLEGSTDNSIIGNTASGTGDGGVLLMMRSDRNRIEGNEFVELGDAGVLVSDSHGNEVVENSLGGMSDAGVRLNNANNTLVRDNDLRSNPRGVQADGSSRSVIMGNDASHSGGTGIELGAGTLESHVVSNTANSNGGRGIYVEGEAGPGLGNLIEGNTTNGNGGGGIVVAKAEHTIRGNAAYNNQSWGILAAAGNVDGGDNVASGNSEAEQCSGVVCGVGDPPPPPPVDDEPPETYITDGPPPSTQEDSATFSFIGVDNVTPADEIEFECRLDSEDELAWEGCESPLTYTGLAPGPHTFSVRAIDDEDNVDPTPATYTWTVLGADDTTAPTVEITEAPSDSQDTTATFEFVGSDDRTEAGDLTFECELDGGGYRACLSPITYQDLAVGGHTFRVRATDEAGNTGQAAVHEWAVLTPADTTAPTVEITEAPSDSQDTTATVAYTAEDDRTPSGELVIECSLDGEALTSCVSPVELEGLAVGEHTFVVRATDAAGNTGEARVSWTVLEGDDTCTETTMALPAEADSWVNQVAPTANHGNDTGLRVSTKNRNLARSLVRFDLESVPPECEIIDARLRLFATSARTGRTLEALRVTAPWTESGVTWNNQPSTSGPAATTQSGPGYREWAVTPQVTAMRVGLNGGFLVRDAVESGNSEQVFASRESSATNQAPQLVITLR